MFLSRLPSAPFVVSLAPPDAQVPGDVQRQADIHMVVLRDAHAGTSATPLPGPSTTWIGWNRSDTDGVVVAAYAAGARCVLPAETPGDVFARVLTTLLLGANARILGARPANGLRRHYKRGDRLLLDPNDVLRVESGVIAQRVVHHDGSEVLIGLSGPSQLVLGHPDDSCCLDRIAHQDAGVIVQSWADAIRAEDFAAELRARLRQLEAWSAVQARPHLSSRIVGLLSLLAEQFGRLHQAGVLIDVRLTHSQFAAATASTRATVTRALGQLRRRRVVWSVGRGGGQRYGLRSRGAHSHGHGDAARPSATIR